MANEELITTQNEGKDSQVTGNIQQAENSAEITHDYWLMTQRMESGSFYKSLEAFRDSETKEFLYDCILSIDFGHGETVAYAMLVEQFRENILKGEKDSLSDMLHPKITNFLDAKFSKDEKKIYFGRIEPEKSLKFDPKEMILEDKKTVIPTMLGFENEKTFIGKDAKCKPEFYQHFKRYPGEKSADGMPTGNWSDNASPDAEKEITYKSLMYEYFKKVFHNIKKYNDRRIEEAFEKGRLLICVGCPTSNNWLEPEQQKKFAKLVSEATGNPHVAVVPESTAALMTGMLCGNHTRQKNKNQKVNIGEGIAIFDFGSSTIDFTYIKPGGIIITKSILLGGYNIDEQILDEALKSINAELKRKGEEEKDWDKAEEINCKEKHLIAAREAKETYYDNPGSNEKIHVFDMPVYINKSFMDNKVWGKNEGSAHEGQQLLDKCRAFIQSCYDAVDTAYGCANVLICGGTAKVTEFEEIVEDVFKNSKFIPYGDTTFCVAEGLCLMKKIEYIGQLYSEKYRDQTRMLAEYVYYEKVLKIAASKLAPIVIDKIMPIIDNGLATNATMTDEEFKDKAYEAITGGSEYTDCMDDISEAIYDCLEGGSADDGDKGYLNECRYRAYEIAENIYEKDFDFVLTLSNSPKVIGNTAKNPYEKAIQQALVDLLYSKEFIWVMSWIVKRIINLQAMDLPVPVKTTSINAKKAAQDMLMNIRQKTHLNSINKKKLWKFAGTTINDSFEDRLAKDLAREFKEDYFLSTEIKKYFELNAEAILGKVMLYVYDNPPKEL
ncbi:MAG: hypothetical protein IKK85_04420 [Clostridia bacterium]|nr:hypothetical protein [Clostridia bacterium]